MKLSHNFTKTIREVPADEIAKNAQLLIKAGYINKTMAGVYSYLPLGLRMLNKIENIVRTNMNAIGCQEILMNSLHPKDWWLATNRWENVDILFKVKSQTQKEYAIACSHEEQVTPVVGSYINSWKDLPEYSPESSQATVFPLATYQIQTKFRDELRSKSGLLRGREFRMKDMYDFHATKESADAYYELVKATYLQIYTQMGLKAYAVHASGGIFTSNDSHEFQVICSAGEDEILFNPETNYAINTEIVEVMTKNGEPIPDNLQKAISAEVGNIFKLDDKYTKAFGITFTDKENKMKNPLMNCHGIGTSRCMGVIAEIHSDEKGLCLPSGVAPFEIHLITSFNDKDDETLKKQILELGTAIYSRKIKLVQNTGGKYTLLDTSNTEQLLNFAKENSSFSIADMGTVDQILWDDRTGKISIGEKIKDADLIGCPVQIVISKRSLENGGVEVVDRKSGSSQVVKV